MGNRRVTFLCVLLLLAFGQFSESVVPVANAFCEPGRAIDMIWGIYCCNEWMFVTIPNGYYEYDICYCIGQGSYFSVCDWCQIIWLPTFYDWCNVYWCTCW
jgi:hypothetical protein